MNLRNLFVAVYLVILCGCNSSTSTLKDHPRTLRTCLAQDILSLDPRKGVNMVSQGVVRMLFTGLVRLDENLQPRLELAESYRTSNDFKTFVFTLKECFWSDGSPITAYDFEHTWKAALTPAYSSTCSNMFFYLKNGRKAFLGQVSVDQLGVKALDDKTLVIELETANPNFLNILVHLIFSPVHSSMRYDPPKTSNFICSGPFCLKKYAFQDQIILTKNSHYWNASTVKLDQLCYYIIKDPITALMMFEKNEIDWLGEPLSKIDLESIPSLRAKGILNSYPMAGLQWMMVNNDVFPLSNVNIRKALAYAIDRKTIMHDLLHLQETNPTLGLIPKIVKKQKWHPWFKDNDIQLARALLEKGLQELGLSRTDFPKIKLSYSTTHNVKLVQAVQQMWKSNLGIDIQIEQLDGSVLFSKCYEHDFQIAWIGSVLQYNDPANMLEFFKYKNAQPNYTGWENPDFIEHTNCSLSTLSEEERWEHMEAAEKIFCEEMPAIPVNDFTAFYLQQPYVKGVSVNHLYLVDFDRAYLDLPLEAEPHAH